MMLYRATVFEFYFLVLGLAAFSFSPGAVLWTGIAGALGWLGTFAWRSHGLHGVLNGSDIPPRPSAEQVTAVVLDPAFGALGSRVQEGISLVVVAFLLAVVMHRARRTLTRQLEAERDRSAISGMFGRFVPRQVGDAMIGNRGALEPVERVASVLFADVAGFTRMIERAGAAPHGGDPERVLRQGARHLAAAVGHHRARTGRCAVPQRRAPHDPRAQRAGRGAGAARCCVLMSRSRRQAFAGLARKASASYSLMRTRSGSMIHSRPCAVSLSRTLIAQRSKASVLSILWMCGRNTQTPW